MQLTDKRVVKVWQWLRCGTEGSVEMAGVGRVEMWSLEVKKKS